MKWLRQRRQLKQKAIWSADLEWFRVRYADAAQTAHALTVLSAKAAAGRLAILFACSDKTAALTIGIAKPFVPLLQQMAQDFDFMLSFGMSFGFPDDQQLIPYANCQWTETFSGQLIHGHLFRHDTQLGMPFPTPRSAGTLPMLPSAPAMGLSRQPQWDNYLATTPFDAAEAGTSADWLIGYSAAGQLVSTSGQVGIYGEPATMDAWLTHQLTATLKHDTSHLVVLDLGGDVVSALKRKPVVTRLLNEQIRYLNLAGQPHPTVLNPLAPLQDEQARDTLRRWRRWFSRMALLSFDMAYLDDAFQAGVRDLFALQKWLKGERRRRQSIELTRLEGVVNRLLNDETLRDWLGVSTEPLISDTTLLFGYPDPSWGGRQIARAVIIAALRDPRKRIVLNLPFLSDTKAFEYAGNPLLLTAPNFPVQTEVTLSWATLSETVRRDARLLENAELLRAGECIAVRANQATFLHW